MEKVVVKLTSLNKAIFNLAAAGCDAIEISLVEHALKVEGVREDGETITFHVWSKDAENVEAQIGKGRSLTEEELKLFDQGKCPICQGQLYKEPKKGLALEVFCDNKHRFFYPPKPYMPEYLEPEAPVEEPKEPKAEEKPEPEVKALEDVNGAPPAPKALPEKEPEEKPDKKGKGNEAKDTA